MKKRIISILLFFCIALSAIPMVSAVCAEDSEHWTNLTPDVVKTLNFPNNNCYVVYYYDGCGYSRRWVPEFQKKAEELGIQIYAIEATEAVRDQTGDLLENLTGGKWPVLIEYDAGQKYSYANVHSIEDFEKIVTGNGKRIVGDFVIQLDELSIYRGSARELVIPADLGITGIRYRCFYDNDNLRSVTIPEGVENIREFAFCSCKGLLEVYLPTTLKRVEDRAFLNCYGNPTLYFTGNQPEIEGTYTFGVYQEGLNQSRIAAVLPEGNSTWNTEALNGVYANVYWGAKPGQIRPIPGVNEVDKGYIDAWAVPYVSEAISYGLRPDYLRYHSAYNRSVNRENFCYIVMNLIYKQKAQYSPEIQSLSTESPFTDARGNDISRAAALGIVNGKGEGKFDPNGKITRQEAACMLYRAGKYLGLEKSGTSMTFSDAASIASWAKESVDYVTALGIMNGTGTGFDPNGLYTFQQAYTTFLRLYQALTA